MTPLATDWLYLRPDEMWTLGATTTGTVADDFLASWLTDGRPALPVKAAGSPGGLSLSMTGSAGDVDLLAVVNHNLVTPVTISGDLSATITPASTRPPHGIQLNPYTVLDGSPGGGSVTNLALSVSGNDETEVIGEFVAGKMRTFRSLKLSDNAFTEEDFSVGLEGDLLNIPAYDEGVEQRTLKGSQLYTTAERDDLIAWWQAQRGGSLPSLLIPDQTVNDAWLVQLLKPSFTRGKFRDGRWFVTLSFVEYPRYRW